MPYGLDERNIRQSPGLWYPEQLLTGAADETSDDINGDFQVFIPWEHPDLGPQEGRQQFVQEESRGFWHINGQENAGWSSPSVAAFTQALVPRGHFAMLRRVIAGNLGDDPILFEFQISIDGGQNWNTVLPFPLQGGGTVQLDPILQFAAPHEPTPDPAALPAANTLNAGGDVLFRNQVTQIGQAAPRYTIYYAGTFRTTETYGDYLPPQRYGEAAFE
jgi:hypothetical protein